MKVNEAYEKEFTDVTWPMACKGWQTSLVLWEMEIKSINYFPSDDLPNK